MSDAPESHEYLTVRELAEMLRLKERKVYDLAASGEVPCSRATGKLLFPAAEVRRWIAGAQTGRVPAERSGIVLGSHDPLLDWAIRESRCGLATYFDGSHDGLERFVAGEGIAAGLHVFDAGTSGWNVPVVSKAAAGQNAALIGFATRRRGLVHRKEGPAPNGLADLPELRVVPRQAASGTDGLFREMLARAGLGLDALSLTGVARTEDEAVAAVSRGEADVAFGIEAVANGYGLAFLPVIEESFALLVDRKGWFEPGLRALAAFCGTMAFRERAASLGGYDVTAFGEVQWNA